MKKEGKGEDEGPKYLCRFGAGKNGNSGPDAVIERKNDPNYVYLREPPRFAMQSKASREIAFIPKKVELLIRFFEPFWILRVFHFSLRTFGKVEPHSGPLGASDETYIQSKFDISGSNETMQNALASIV